MQVHELIAKLKTFDPHFEVHGFHKDVNTAGGIVEAYEAFTAETVYIQFTRKEKTGDD